MIPQNALKTVLNLRMLAIVVFPLATVLLALLERSVLMVAVLAIGMMISSAVERRRLPETRGLLQPAALISGAAVRFGLLAGLFVICLGIFTLFRETALARSLQWIDLLIFLGATGLSVGANEISARIAATQINTGTDGISSIFAQTSPGNSKDADGVIIEGELSDPDTKP
ncbi:MAG: hypothetical protein ACRBEQ_09165 [Hyphomonas sp.]